MGSDLDNKIEFMVSDLLREIIKGIVIEQKQSSQKQKELESRISALESNQGLRTIKQGQE